MKTESDFGNPLVPVCVNIGKNSEYKFNIAILSFNRVTLSVVRANMFSLNLIRSAKVIVDSGYKLRSVIRNEFSGKTKM